MASAEVEGLSSADAGVEGEINVVAVAPFNVSADVGASKGVITTTVEVGEGEVVDLGGRTTISHKGTETLRLISSLIGICWRKLTSIG